MDLVVDPAPDGVKLPGTGYTSGSLQDNITISNDKGLIGGHLKYTTGMVTMYPDDRLKQEGNFIALWLHEIGDPYVNYDTIEAKIVDGAEEKELEVSDEGYICFRVNDRATTKLVVTVTIGDQTYDAEYKLTGLTVDSYGWNILKGTNLTGEDLYQWAESYSTTSDGDFYSDDETGKYFRRTSPENFQWLSNTGLEIINEDITDSTGLSNEWLKSQLTVRKTNSESINFNLNIYSLYVPLKNNTTYTISYYEKGTQPLEIVIASYMKNGGVFKDAILSTKYTVNPHPLYKDKFNRTVVSFSTTGYDLNGAFVAVGVHIERGSPENQNPFEWTMAGFKLEEGDHATGWDDYWSGDNLLLDTDQPVISKVNDHVTNNDARSFFFSSELVSQFNTASIQFIPDSDLPEKDLKINNKIVFQFNQTGNVEGGIGYSAISYNLMSMDTITDETFKDGDIVTLSFYAKINEKLSNEEPINNYIEFRKNGTEQKAFIFFYQTSPEVKITKCLNDWSRYVVTSVVDKENYFPVQKFFIGVQAEVGSRIQDYHMEFCGMKLEKGAHVTDYRPAPTDFNINYFLNSELNLTNDKYCVTDDKNIELISDFNNDASYEQPLVITMDADINPSLDHFEAFFVMSPGNVRGMFGPGSGNKLTKVKSNSYYNYILYGRVPNVDTSFEGAYSGSIFKGFDIYTMPKHKDDGLNSTIRKLKLEFGRYPTKWVDGVGDPVSADEEDDDLEVT